MIQPIVQNPIIICFYCYFKNLHLSNWEMTQSILWLSKYRVIYFLLRLWIDFCPSICVSLAVISNQCSGASMVTHAPSGFPWISLHYSTGLPSFFSSVTTFPTTVSICARLALGLIQHFLSLLSARQALGLYCKYEKLQWPCLIVLESRFLPNVLVMLSFFVFKSCFCPHNVSVNLFFNVYFCLSWFHSSRCYLKVDVIV